MPNYDYECTSCGHRFEVFQNMTDAPKKTCPKCKKAVRRMIGSGMGIIFKGSGFYETDYKKKDYGKSDNGGACKSCPKSDTCEKNSN